MDSDVPPVPPQPKPSRPDGRKLNVCSSYGFCICTEAVKTMFAFRNAVFVHMKALCRPGSKNRTLLADGYQWPSVRSATVPVDQRHHVCLLRWCIVAGFSWAGWCFLGADVGFFGASLVLGLLDVLWVGGL
eukprot:3571739-Pyramimonas_sp.AAC.1